MVNKTSKKNLLTINILCLVTECTQIIGYTAASIFMAVHSSWAYEGCSFVRNASN